VVGTTLVRYNGIMQATSRGPVTVYLLDDHDVVRRGLRDLLVTASDVHVVGDSAQARTAADAILQLGADVMLLDLQLQDGSGVHVCREVRSVDPSVRAILLTAADDDDALAAAVLAGASAYAVKLASISNVTWAVRSLGAGRTLIGDAEMARASAIVQDRADRLEPGLSDDETHLLDQILAGQTDDQIAEKLGLDVSAARSDVAGLIDRLLRS
jgi:DNA-binding NarL/FixJ family response regulator